MRALIYSRVSEDRAHGRSVEEQEAEARRVCAAEGWEVAEAITDSVGASRHSKGKRTGWARATRILEAGEVDVLVTWEASRANRDLTAYAALRDLCAQTGTLWCYSGRTHDLTTSDGRFTTGLDALLAEKEADQTAERVQRAIRANAAKGRPHGRRLFGYQRTYDPTTGQLTGQIPYEPEAAVVRRIFADYLTGMGVPAISRRLNAEGITTGTGGRWEGSQVRRVLINPSYVGLRVHRGEVAAEATWEGLVPREDFDRANTRLKAWPRHQQNHTPAHRLLTAVTRCGLCGGRMHVGHDRGKRKVYQCRAYFHVSRDEKDVDDYVTSAIIARLEQPDVSQALTEAPTPEVHDARERVNDLRARLESAVGEYTAGNLTAPTLARIEGQLLAEIAAAEAELRRTVIPLSFEVPTTDIAQWWGKLERHQRRELATVLLSAVVIHPAGKGRRYFNPAVEVELHWR